MPTRLLITGAAGMLGRDVVAAAADAGIECAPFARGDLDITERSAVEAAVSAVRPHAVINCAAWTDVDGAEAAFEEAHAVNGPGAGNVARAAAAVGAWTVHMSSDYVFDGAKRKPYLESDRTGPLSAYGRSKLAGEEAVSSEAPGRHTIVRSSWLFGPGGHCFPATIMRLARERDELRVVDDQIGCPTFTGHLARALVALGVPDGDPPLGIIHVAGGGSCSWFELATAIVQTAGLGTEVRPCSTAEMPRPAPRPAYSVLASERVQAPVLPHWRQGLEEYMASGVPAR